MSKNEGLPQDVFGARSAPEKTLILGLQKKTLPARAAPEYNARMFAGSSLLRVYSLYLLLFLVDSKYLKQCPRQCFFLFNPRIKVFNRRILNPVDFG